MALTDLRRRVIFQNSIDVWIESCIEVGAEWDDIPKYKKFITHLRERSLNLKAFNLCAHEAGATEEKKTGFAEALRETGDPDAATYTIKLNDTAIGAVRDFHKGS